MLPDNDEEETPGNFMDDHYDPNTAYPADEEYFVKVKEILDRNDRLGHFSTDFTKLLDAWKESHTREVFFVQTKQAIKAQFEICSSELEASKKLIKSHDETIERLSEEIKQAWRMVDEAHSREEATQETLDSLRVQLTKLTQELEMNKRMGGDQDHESGALVKNKEMLMKEKERLMAELLVAKGKITKASKYQKDLEDKCDQAEKKIKECATQIEALKNELAKEKRFKEKLEEDLSALREEISDKDKQLANKSVTIQNHEKTIAKFEQTVKEQKTSIDRVTKEVSDATAAQKITKAELEQCQANLARLSHDLTTKIHDLKLKEEECQRLKLEEQKIRKTKENVVKKLEAMESQRSQIETDKGKLVGKIEFLEKQLNEQSKQIISDRKIIEALNRERELVTKATQKTQAMNKEQAAVITMNQVERKRLEDEIITLQNQITKLQKELKEVSAERESTLDQLGAAKRHIQQEKDEIQLQETHLQNANNKLADVEAKLQLHTNLFEQVRTERNKVSKRLVEAEDEINELKHKLKVKTYEVEQLKQDMTAKENMLVKGEFILQKVTKEKESLRLERQKMSTELQENKLRIQTVEQDEKRLQNMIEDEAQEKVKLAKQLTQALNERDYLASQINQQNEEMTMLFEKNAIFEESIKKSEAQYKRRLEDIRLLKIEVKRLRQEKSLMSRSLDNNVDLRRETFLLQRDLTRERLKCRVLEEQQANPLNVHRWRKLEGSDPNTMELIRKVALLQKRLLTASEETIKREEQLSKCQNQIKELENMMEQRSPENLAKKLHSTMLTLREKDTKVKVLQAQLSMYESQVSEVKIDLELKSKEADEVKKKYFGLKRQQQKMQDREREEDMKKPFFPLIDQTAPNAKFVGGGFNLASTQSKIS